MTFAHDARYSAIPDDDADREGSPRPGPCKQTRTEQSAMRAGHAGWMQHAWSGGGSSNASIQRMQQSDAPASAATAPSQLDPWDMTDGMMSAMGLAATAEEGVAAASSPLPHLDAIQKSFGRHDVRGIRAQIGGAAAKASARLGAHAYATGSRIAFAKAPDLHTAAHEAAHVLQQASGQVSLPGGIGERGDRYEQHADEVADAVVAGKSAEALLDRFAPPTSEKTAPAPPAGPQRLAVQLQPSDYKSAVDLKAMSLGAFDTYAHSQADWTSSQALNGSVQQKADKEDLRRLLIFARANHKLILNGCGNLNVGELLAAGVAQGNAVDKTLRTYASAATPGAQNTTTIHATNRATTAVLALSWGAALEKLVPALGGNVVASIVTQQPMARMLEHLAQRGQVDDLISYLQSHTPILDGGGMEVAAFSDFAREGGLAQLALYKAQLPEIRNYHRFTKPQLDALIANKAKAKTNRASDMPLPICVVLRSGFDKNGAFRRDESLTKVICRDTHLTFVVEGKATLDAYGQELEAFAAYGRDGKIDEALLSGHGNTTFISMAGDGRFDASKPGYSKTSQQPVSLDARLHPTLTAATGDLYARLAKVLRDDPSTRVVMQACLTNSNSIDDKLDDNPDTAAAQIQQAIQARPNVVEGLKRALAGHQAQVIGTNGSAYQPWLLDGPQGESGNIALVSPLDAELTAPDKLDYVQRGTEPQGVMRAILEQWAKDREGTLAALRDRAARTAQDLSWKERIISALLELILAAPDDAEQIRRFDGVAAGLAEMSEVGSGTLKHLDALKLSAPELAAILPRVEASDFWQQPLRKHIPLVFLQRWIERDAAKIPALHLFLGGSTYDTASAGRLFDWTRMAPLAAQLLPPPPIPTTPPRGTFLLALLALQQLGKGAPPEAVAYLKAVVGQGNQVFPATCNVDAILAGTTTHQVLLDAGIATAGPAQEPNVAPTGAGNNTVAITSLLGKGRTKGFGWSANAYMLPAGDKIGTISNGTSLQVLGYANGPMKGRVYDEQDVRYFAVEHADIAPYKVVFVDSADIVPE